MVDEEAMAQSEAAMHVALSCRMCVPVPDSGKTVCTTDVDPQHACATQVPSLRPHPLAGTELIGAHLAEAWP